LDIGHAVHSLAIAFKMLGWEMTVINNATCFNLVDDEAIHALLGLDDIKGTPFS